MVCIKGQKWPLVRGPPQYTSPLKTCLTVYDVFGDEDLIWPVIPTLPPWHLRVAFGPGREGLPVLLEISTSENLFIILLLRLSVFRFCFFLP